jgi:HAD superfamily hydrolase (TIGR01509 family)
VAASLDAVGIAGLFDVIVTVSDVDHGKPAPDAYLRAIDLLGVRADACVAYEDTASGLESARGAGIPVIVDVRWHDA